ncbi:hypothetical protein AVEN_85487-1 [Araneus ventricosus]|uniref:Uncharacterized protein n=1 Tax=Araneus ventricosus TaxID=182803 RepID=A0A4Y2HZW3_ARAVE|nr:hypothetical protein AVEN_85487-1 [Araneus ventricosus]
MLHERPGFASDPLIEIAILKEIGALKKMKDSRAGSLVKGGNSADPIVMEGSNTQRRSEIVPELFKYDADRKLIISRFKDKISSRFYWKMGLTLLLYSLEQPPPTIPSGYSYRVGFCAS